MIRPGWLLFVKSFLASCFCRAGTNHIVKYELPAERVEVEITLSGYSSRSNYYRWGGYSGVDLAVDEQGLWVLWGSTSNSKRLYATQIDVYKNSLNHQWALSTGKRLNFCKHTVFLLLDKLIVPE